MKHITVAILLCSVACGRAEIIQRVVWSVNGHAPFKKVQDIAFSRDGLELVSAGEDRSVRVWSTADGTLRRQVTELPSAVGAARLSPDGSLLATCSFIHEGTEQSDRTIRIWRFADLTPLAVVTGHPRGIQNIAWSPDGAWIASVDVAGTVRLVRTSDWTIVATQTSTFWPVMDVEFIGKGWLATLSFDGTFRRHRLPSLEVTWQDDTALHSVFSSMAIVDNGRWATQVSFNQVAWWDLKNDTVAYSQTQITQAYFAKPTHWGNYVVFGGIGGTKEIEFWDIKTRQRVAMFDTDIAGFDAPYGLAFAPGRSLFAYGTFRGRVVLATWNRHDLARH
ncbi:MAG TPA: hypothetical protein PLL78_01890 [Fimbriimonadaceae bacterium]|nr:hypothetical protein [Fimbriimonadaceae bacterium]HRJ95409.1 hypothetical protein [Fimbriimonadaceae bacterium]